MVFLSTKFKDDGLEWGNFKILSTILPIFNRKKEPLSLL